MTDQERIEKKLDMLETAVASGQRGMRGALASAFMMGMNTKTAEEAPKEDDIWGNLVQRLDTWIRRVAQTPDRYAKFTVSLVPNGMQWDDDGTLFYEFKVTEAQESDLEGFLPQIPKKENP